MLVCGTGRSAWRGTVTMLMLGACGGVSGEAPSPATRPNVLIVTLDTTRADYLSAYGDPRAPQTPTFDGLAAEGWLFERAYASCPLTIPSHSTLFTGQYPPTHGVRDNGSFILPDEAVTLAERFHDAGWTTAAFTSAFPTHRRWGFSQGFDTYVDALPRNASVQDWRDQRTAGEVVDDALTWMAGTDEPVFVWLHLFDAHWPYVPPEPFRSMYEEPYAGEVAYADHELGRFVEAFNARGEASLIVVTSDHGEGLGDGGEDTHGFLLHDGTMHVPLVVVAPGLDPRRISTPVSHVDVVPTVLGLAGLPLHEGLEGVDLREGGSGRAYSEALTGQYAFGLAPLRSVVDETGRWMRGGYDSWYPWKPAIHKIDTTPVSPGDAESLAAMDAWTAELDAASTALSQTQVDAAALQALGYVAGDPATPAGGTDPRDVIDVIPLTWRIRTYASAGRFREARTLLAVLAERMPDTLAVEELEVAVLAGEGQAAEALSRIHSQYAAHPRLKLARQAGDLSLSLGLGRDAEDWFARVLDQVPNDVGALVGQTRAAVLLDEPERAYALTRDALLLYPDHPELNLVEGAYDLANHDAEGALARAYSALEEMPFSPWALSLAASAHRALGQPERAVDLLEQARAFSPFDVSVRLQLVDLLLETGRNVEAVKAIAPIARIAPDHVEAGAALARAQRALDEEIRVSAERREARMKASTARESTP